MRSRAAWARRRTAHAKMTGGVFPVAEGHDIQKTDRVLRMLATASRSLRLYPAASPIPRQSVEAVTDALAEAFADGVDSLQLAVAREGFESNGEPVALGVPGGRELAPSCVRRAFRRCGLLSARPATTF